MSQDKLAQFTIGDHSIGDDHPTYFIADIAANHDGDLARAIDLIYMAADAGANAAKFQHFTAKTIVSDLGFRTLNSGESHQSNWRKSVFDTYKDASVNLGWTSELVRACKNANIEFFTSPYSLDLVEAMDQYVQAYKIGSGDITWHQIIARIASKQKPVILASGASSMDEVVAAVELALSINPNLALLQCNTNYTGNIENFKYINLKVLESYRAMFPRMILGLSDHTHGHSTVLGAVALGARIIEKHFTDNIGRVGPDHAFSMDPNSWRAMVVATRELEAALGVGIKRVEQNEKETVILQRRSIRVRSNLSAGHIIQASDLECLRPCPMGACSADQAERLVGMKLTKEKYFGDCVYQNDIE